MAITDPQAWPYAKNLENIRGHLSVSKAARMVDVDRQTWTAWESGKQRPKHETLKAIVEAFNCPPDLVGYEAPQGWELVPAAWIQEQATQAEENARQQHEALMDRLDAIEQALATDLSRVRTDLSHVRELESKISNHLRKV